MINDIIDEQKSVMLAKAVGWIRPASDGYLPGIWVFDTGGFHSHDNSFWRIEPDVLPFFNLYDTNDMPLAWRVLNWAMAEEIEGRLVVNGSKIPLTDWYVEQDLDCKPPDVAQRAWLDKIFELAIEAGLVDAEGVKVG